MKYSKELLEKLGVRTKPVRAPSANRIRGGAEAKRQGKAFEERLMILGRIQSVGVVRLPDGCKQVGPKGIVRVKSPFDFILGFDGHIAMIDTKSTADSSLSMKSLPQHQIDAMALLSRHCRAGFLVWFRRYGTVNFFEIKSAIVAGKMRFDSGHAIGDENGFQLRKIF